MRKGFLADHSSTSYEFLAIDKPLDEKAKQSVSKLSSRVRPSSRRANFFYNADWSDLPGGWESLMEKYYDVMCYESYDWWTLAIAFDSTAKQISDIKHYEFVGADDLGVRVTVKGKRAIISVHCLMSNDALFGLCGGSDQGNDPLLDMLGDIRKQLIAGDYSALYAAWETYGCEGDEDVPPEPRKYQKSKLAGDLKEMFATL